MRFIIRADAYRINGAGHVMRSSVIAEELMERGHEVIFIGNLHEIPWVEDYILNLGFKGIYKPEEDFLTNPKSDILILDSYDIAIEDTFIQPENWKKILVLVDDTTPAYLANIYIHTGAETSWRVPKSVTSSIFVTGLKYLLMRKSLQKLKNRYRPAESNYNILISSGGSDPFGFAQSLVNLLAKSNSNFHAMILSPSFELPQNDSRFELIQLGKDYEVILSDLNLIFTTAGTSSWEYVFLGIPTALASAVQNQERNYRYQIENGFSWDLGYRDIHGIWQFNESLIRKVLAVDWKNRLEMNMNSGSVDGNGAFRILNLLTSDI